MQLLFVLLCVIDSLVCIMLIPVGSFTVFSDAPILVYRWAFDHKACMVAINTEFETFF